MLATAFDAVNKVWLGPNPEFKVNEHQNVGEFLLKKLELDPEFVAQINGDTGEWITKAEIRKRAIRCAQNLKKLGCTQSDCISIVARNHHNLTPLLFGALCNGTPVSPLDVIIPKKEKSTILQRVRPSIIFCDADVLQTIKKITTEIGLNAKLFTVNGSVDGFDSIDSLMVATGTERSFVCAKIKNSFSHIALIACSSGSTGPSKSICMSHALFLYTLLHENFEFAHVHLCFSSLYWVSGILGTMSTAFNNHRIFTSKSFSTDLFFDVVDKYKISSYTGTPPQFQAIITSERARTTDLSSILKCFVIGSSVPQVLLENVQTIIPNCALFTIYGTTEVCGAISRTAPNELEQHPNSAGRLVPGANIKIINDSTGAKCGIEEEGEIYLKLPISSMGYYKDEMATRNSSDSEGYFISGDLGYFDRFGRLIINGRKKDVFKSCSYPVWPIEIENLILKHGSIKNVSVVGVYDDEKMTELPAAVVIRQEECSITENEVYNIVAGQLATYKCLDGGIYFVNKLPLTPSGKIVRSKVKEVAQKWYQQRKNDRKNCLSSI
ncbi:4-coumarate--CoA ligase-like 7 [Contarinia nasturtii]|uniref:4-coumarate--CoA ligase-like 7 n=1 Tax=Contarinia nasturtii TaxID=265458 RepID=UPI0012D46B32|nr:4-coumarate--CoA ligase-like 7 [Contarinia nasturtii]